MVVMGWRLKWVSLEGDDGGDDVDGDEVEENGEE